MNRYLIVIVLLISIQFAYSQIIINEDVINIDLKGNNKLEKTIKDFKSYNIDLLSFHQVIRSKRRTL